jgi:hypothetical protein
MNWKIERRQLDTITEYPHNPRVITKKGLADLKRSIDKFGLAEPLVINTDGILIGGHARYQVLKSQGVTEVDAYVPERELSEEEYRELNVRLNKNIAGEFDFDILANEFDLPDLIEWGFEETELIGLAEPNWADGFAGVKEGDKPEFQQMTFTLHDSQAETVQEAMKLAKANGLPTDSPNENSNGNALWVICKGYLQHGG